MKYLFWIFVTLSLLEYRCSASNALERSVMIYDSQFPDLPAYSEWGFNTFGAYYDRIVFISNNQTPAKVIVTNNRMMFVLNGQQGALDAYSYQGTHTQMSMTFDLPGYTPGNYPQLIQLNDTTFDLTNPSYSITMSIDSVQYPATILSGMFTFNRAQNLTVDKVQTEVILSGIFEFKAIVKGTPVTVSDGRFDVGIGPDNFYNY